ncbi:MAG: hypothetical protein RL071_4745 [Pseudomonadota bacterium]
MHAPPPEPAATAGDARDLRSLPGRAELGLGAVISALLGVLVTWPVALHPTTLVVGHPGNDSWNHTWGYWWVLRALAQGKWPGNADQLSFPDGGSLYFIDTVQAVLLAPVAALIGAAAAYNLAMGLGVALAGFGAFVLARRVSGDGPTALVALAIYGAAPHLLGQAYNGISETVCAGWLPLTLFLLIRTLDAPALWRGALLGLCAGLTMGTSWYYGLFAAIGGTVILAVQALSQPEAVRWRSTLPTLMVALTVAAVIVGPLLLTFRGSLEAADAIVSRDPAFVRASLMNHNITDAAALLRPGKTPSPDLLALYGEQLIIVVYLGWVGVGLSAAALALTRRRLELAPWLALGGTFLLFCLGPYLNIGGTWVEPFGRRLPLPFLLLFDAIPLFDRISHPFRFVVGGSLALAVLSSVGLRHLLRRQGWRPRLAAALGVAALSLAETAALSPAHLPVPTGVAALPQAYHDMREDDVPGAVLDLPMTVPNLERAVYVWAQTAHERPVPWGLNEPMPAGLLRNRLTATLIRVEATRARTLPPRLPELELVVAGRALQRMGYRYIVLHEELLPKFKAEAMISLLDGIFGPHTSAEADTLRIWKLEALGEPGPARRRPAAPTTVAEGGEAAPAEGGAAAPADGGAAAAPAEGAAAAPADGAAAAPAEGGAAAPAEGAAAAPAEGAAGAAAAPGAPTP